MVQADEDADVSIVRAAVDSSKPPRSLDTDLLILLIYHGNVNCQDLYFWSDKGKPTIYNIRVPKDLLGDQVCTDLLFVYAFTGWDTSNYPGGLCISIMLKYCLCTTHKADVKSAGCEAVVSIPFIMLLFASDDMGGPK